MVKGKKNLIEIYLFGGWKGTIALHNKQNSLRKKELTRYYSKEVKKLIIEAELYK